MVFTEELIYMIDNEDNYLEFKQDFVSQFIPWLLSTNFNVAYMTYSEDSFYCTRYLLKLSVQLIKNKFQPCCSLVTILFRRICILRMCIINSLHGYLIKWDWSYQKVSIIDTLQMFITFTFYKKEDHLRYALTWLIALTSNHSWNIFCLGWWVMSFLHPN